MEKKNLASDESQPPTDQAKCLSTHWPGAKVCVIPRGYHVNGGAVVRCTNARAVESRHLGEELHALKQDYDQRIHAMEERLL